MFGKTLRDDPADVEISSHRLMIKAGMLHQISSGIYSYLPMAWISMQKIEQIIREELSKVDAQELRMPVVQPQEIWDQSGRTEAYGPELFKFQDRHERKMVLAPTHEEILSLITKANVLSYRDLPIILFQIQTKLRDEPRARGGLLRTREFDMKDAYSFDIDEDGLDKNYLAMNEAYKSIFQRCGLNVIVVEADSGTIGGRDSHEFILPAPAGEDEVILCENCGYSANSEKAIFSINNGIKNQMDEMTTLSTPNIKTIGDLCENLNITPIETLKSLFYMADQELILIVIRGDQTLNETKLRNLLNVSELNMASDKQVTEAGFIPGFCSPVGISNTRVIADCSIENGSNFIAGGNKINVHLKNVNFPRDFSINMIHDIAQVQDQSICAKCSNPMKLIRGIEVGHIFKLGTRYSESMDVTFQDQNGIKKPIVMGCYGIGIGRLLAAAIEQNHDDKGIVFPKPIAPYQVHLTVLNTDNPDVIETSDKIYTNLKSIGVETLYDDRNETAGVKFNDADLIGIPVRIVVSLRNFKNDVVEISKRSDGISEQIPISAIENWIASALV